MNLGVYISYNGCLNEIIINVQNIRLLFVHIVTTN